MEPFPWRLLGEITTRLRRELGLAPQSAGDNAAMRRALPTLLAYSPAVVPHPDDWPANAHTTGYWFLNEDDDWQPPEALQRFLDAGPPPLYIGFEDVWNAVEHLWQVLDSGEWQRPEFKQKHAVT